jgi:hypothetical protein
MVLKMCFLNVSEPIETRGKKAKAWKSYYICIIYTYMYDAPTNNKVMKNININNYILNVQYMYIYMYVCIILIITY